MAGFDVALPQIESPFEAQGKALQLRSLLQAGQDHEYQQQQRAQAQADDQNYREAMQANPTGGQGLLSALASGGNYKGYAQAAKADLDARKGQGDIEHTAALTTNTKMETLNKAFTLHRDQINGVTDPQTAAQWVAAAYQDPVLGPLVSQGGPMEAAIARIPTDPKGFADWRQRAALNAQEYVKHTTVSADTAATNDRIVSEGKLNRSNTIQVQNMIGARADAKDTNLTHGIKGLSPEQNAALSNSINSGLLNPNRVNGRTASLYADLILKNPNTDFNKLGADATLLNNATYQQKTQVASTLPEIMNNMVTAGKKVGFSDNRTIGKMQAWAKGEFNDPDFTEYMNQRNDALMSIAGVMRGVGMTDMAHKAETEAAAMTMSPQALDAWLRGQMKSLQPRLERNARVMHTDPSGHPLPPGGTATPVVAPGAGAGSPPPAPGAGARPSIDSFFK